MTDRITLIIIIACFTIHYNMPAYCWFIWNAWIKNHILNDLWRTGIRLLHDVRFNNKQQFCYWKLRTLVCAPKCPIWTGKQNQNLLVTNSIVYQPTCWSRYMHRHVHIFCVLLQENSIFWRGYMTCDLPCLSYTTEKCN